MHSFILALFGLGLLLFFLLLLYLLLFSLLLLPLAFFLLAFGMNLVLGLFLRKLFGVVSLEFLENWIVIEHSVEFELTGWTILVVERPIELLLLGGINQEIKL